MVDFVESYKTNEFVVEIDGIESPKITKVSGLNDGEIDVIEQADGGANIIHKISSGIIKFGDLTLERNMDGTKSDEDFKKWFQEMFNAKDGKGAGSKSRKNGSIVLRENQEEIMRFSFKGAWVKSSKFSDLEAGSHNLFKQTIVISVESLFRV